MRTRIYLFFPLLDITTVFINLSSSAYSYFLLDIVTQLLIQAQKGIFPQAEGMWGCFNSLLKSGSRVKARPLVSPVLLLWHIVVFPEFTFNLVKLFISGIPLKYEKHEMDFQVQIWIKIQQHSYMKFLGWAQPKGHSAARLGSVHERREFRWCWSGR